VRWADEVDLMLGLKSCELLILVHDECWWKEGGRRRARDGLVGHDG
jgi:hypothetical protein